MVYSAGTWAAAAAANYAGQVAAGLAEEIPILDPVLTEFLHQIGITFTAFAEALDAIGIDLEQLMRTDALTQDSLAGLWRRVLESEIAWLGNDAMINTIALAVEDNRAHMEATWGAAEIQWQEWSAEAFERRLERWQEDIPADSSFWGKVWDVITDPFGETVDFWGDVFSGIGIWLEDNLLPWFEARAENVVSVAGRILEKVW